MNERMEEKSKLHEEESNGKGVIFVCEQPCRNQLECPEEYSLVMGKNKTHLDILLQASRETAKDKPSFPLHMFPSPSRNPVLH
jgi:hypothetical protein